MNWEIVTIGVFVVVGVMEYLKGFAVGAKPMVWRIALIPASFAVAAVAQAALLKPLWPGVVLMGLMILAASQLGYSVVVEVVKKKLGGS